MVALTGTCLTVAVPVPKEIGSPAVGVTLVTAFDAAVLTVVSVTAAEDIAPAAVKGLLEVATAMACPCLGMTPSPGMMRMVAVGLVSVEERGAQALLIWSATVTARAGIKRMVALVASVTFKSGVTLTMAEVAEALVQLEVFTRESVGCTAGVTCRVAEMPLVPSMSGVSLTVVTGALVNVAIISCVMRSTVWPLESVVMEDGARRSTSFPWIRMLVAVNGIPAPDWVFMPSWPAMAT